jgi:RNA polymerase sigma factor (sigma-70 family)
MLHSHIPVSLPTPSRLSHSERTATVEESTGPPTKGRVLFDEHTLLIHRIIEVTSRRGGFPDADREDFGSWCLVKLLEDDCRRLAGFAGRASFSTFLSVTVANLMRDYRNMRWGKWRPSAAARGLGEVAVELEARLYRDRLSVDAALDRMLEWRPELDRRTLIDLLGNIPTRYRPFSVGAEPLTTIESSARTDDQVLAHERTEMLDEAIQTLEACLESLPSEDAVILEMRFWQGLRISEIARILGLPQKPLYRRIESTMAAIREELEERGLSARQVAGLFT